MLTEHTLLKLRELKLTAMADCYDLQRRQPDTLKLSFDDRFGQLVDSEHEHRLHSAYQRRLQQARLKYRQACLEDLSYSPQRELDRSLITRLSNCDWVRYGHHVLITGPTGAGKTYLGCALAHQACRHGYKVAYYHSGKLFRELLTAGADGTLSKLLRQLARLDLLMLDDWGMQLVRRSHYRDFLELLEERHDKALLLTSQYPPESWHQIIDDATVADAICDRLLHHHYHLQPKGDSLREKLQD